MRLALFLLLAGTLAAQPATPPDRRSGNAFENWYDYRAGLLFTVRKPKTLNLRLGYLWHGSETANSPLQTEHRFFAGPVLYLRKHKPQVRLISLYERSRLGPTPFVSTESFLEETCVVTQRSRAWAPRHAAVLIFNRGIRIDDI